MAKYLWYDSRMSQTKAIPKDPEHDGLLSQAQAAKLLNMTREGVRYLLKRGYLQAVKVGPYTLIPRHSIEAYAKTERKPGPKPGTKKTATEK
jgi:excisionase family DNA binding protein